MHKWKYACGKSGFRENWLFFAFQAIIEPWKFSPVIEKCCPIQMKTNLNRWWLKEIWNWIRLPLSIICVSSLFSLLYLLDHLLMKVMNIFCLWVRIYTCENTVWVISVLDILKCVRGWKILVFLLRRIAFFFFFFEYVQLWDKKILCF